MPFELATDFDLGARIKVIGVGGGGGNAVNNMIARDLQGVDFIVANTDSQDLKKSSAPVKIQLGKRTTLGKGAGAKPEIGKASALEDIAEVNEAFKNSDMIFVTCGMGGGTGTGGSPVIAQAAKESGALVVGIVTKPFEFEGPKKLVIAEEGIKELRNNVDSLLIISNEKLLSIIEEDTCLKAAFKNVDDVLYNATRCISDIITNTGLINVDFADVKTVMKDSGDALMGIGIAKGDHRAVVAMESALNSPLLEGVSIKGAQGVLVNIIGGSNISLSEIKSAMSMIKKETSPDAIIIQGIVQKEEELDEIIITVIATRFQKIEENPQIIDNTLNGRRKPELFPTEAPEIMSNRTMYANQVPIDKFANMSADGYVPHNTRPQGELPAVPRGTNDLTEKDVPAFIRRRNGSDEYKEHSGQRVGALIENSNGSRKSRQIDRDILNKPTYIRKIND